MAEGHSPEAQPAQEKLESIHKAQLDKVTNLANLESNRLTKVSPLPGRSFSKAHQGLYPFSGSTHEVRSPKLLFKAQLNEVGCSEAQKLKNSFVSSKSST